MINIQETGKKRIVIVGCGFAGLNLARKLKNPGYQVVIIDKHNYHQFPPLYYQVAIPQAELLSANLKRILNNKSDKELRYRDLGTMATFLDLKLAR